MLSTVGARAGGWVTPDRLERQHSWAWVRGVQISWRQAWGIELWLSLQGFIVQE